MKNEDAKRTVQPGSSDHILLALARLETLTSEQSKNGEKRFLQMTGAINEIAKSQGSLMREVALLTQNAKHNADHILELKGDLKEYSLELKGCGKQLDMVAAVQKSCEARNFWHELQSAYNEDSKVIEVMRHKLQERKTSTPPGGFSLRVSGDKATLSGPMKLVILAVLGALLGAGGTLAAIIAKDSPRMAKTHQGDQ
jgi:hypothetical protein